MMEREKIEYKNAFVNIDYEAECKRLHDIISKLEKEVECMKECIRSVEKEKAIMQGKLDLVYLIFGGTNRV